ncbi:MAG: TolC family protein [Candidatus Saccharicenans sp.]|nr:MAG: hypothetical protein C0168_07285 [Candidatus Aminicenantes bacterium]HEK86823.1 TolC family protein [Candidatus Aminicenantes bacterium]
MVFRSNNNIKRKFKKYSSRNNPWFNIYRPWLFWLLLVFSLSFFHSPGEAENKVDFYLTNPQSRVNSSPEILTLDRCLEIALNHNPLVLSSYDQYQAALARVNIARSFHQPSILLDYPTQPRMFSLNQSNEKYFWINQVIEFPGRCYLRTRSAAYEASENYQEVETTKLNLAYQVKEAFYNLLLAEEHLKYARENFELTQKFADLVEVKYSAGEVSEAEVLRAKVELAKGQVLVQQYETERQIGQARLNVLLGRDRSQPLEIKGDWKPSALEINLEEAKEQALSQRPEIKKIEYSELRAEIQKKQAYLSYLPDFNLGFARHELEGIKYWDFSLSFAVPLFFWQTRRGEVAEAEALIRAGQNEKKYWQDLISLDVEEAYRQALLYQDQIKLFEENMLSQSEKVYDMLLYSFKEGQISGLELIEARRTWLETRITYAENLYQYAISLALLNKAMGKTR